MKKIYKLTQNVNNGYYTFDSCIVVADNEDDAKYISPDRFKVFNKLKGCWGVQYTDGTFDYSANYTWCHPDDVIVELIGITDLYSEDYCILASFNAG